MVFSYSLIKDIKNYQNYFVISKIIRIFVLRKIKLNLTQKKMNKKNAIKDLRKALINCCEEYVKDADSWQIFHNMLEKIHELEDNNKI